MIKFYLFEPLIFMNTCRMCRKSFENHFLIFLHFVALLKSDLDAIQSLQKLKHG